MTSTIIEGHLLRLKSDNWHERYHAVKELGSFKDAAVVSALIGALGDADSQVRCEAVEALRVVGDSTAVPAMIDALTDGEDDNRYQVIQALGEIGDPAAVPALIRVLEEGGWPNAREAAKGLGSIGDAVAAPALIRALRDKSLSADVRCAAARALAEIGDPEAVPALVAAMRDRYRSVREEAVGALGKIGGPAAVPTLIATLTDANWSVRGRAAQTLRELGDSRTLPRRVLAASHLSARERIDILAAIRRVRYQDRYVTVQFDVPDDRALCHSVISEKDEAARSGAQTVLDWLNGDCDLLIGSERANTADQRELLRGSRHENAAVRSDETLRPSSPVIGSSMESVSGRSWLDILLGR